ncbi:Butyryl-CoA dehydrogenase [Hyphomicrobiales bacterium]|nr:Butyryl-CoA dehydrogenase [Hyphomicrobiales bacterium]CAH1692291.1 Butyryl-CoA dehydrogenase [Hyphomicrobiales bacterium]
MMPDTEVSAIVEGVRQFVRREIAPHVQRLEEQNEFPQHVVDAMASLGLFGMVIPEAYGGLELPLEDYVAIMEELGAGWSAMPSFLNSHCTVARLIAQYGTEAQKQRYLPQLADGSRRGAIVLTEPSAGSDLKQIRTDAARQPNGDFVLNGQKTFITNGLRARLHMVLARERTEDGKGTISLFIVESEAEGFEVSRLIDKMGFKHVDTAELRFDDLRLGPDALLGEEAGRGLPQVLSMLETGRLAMAGTAVGMARNALAVALQYSKDRVTFGQPICNHQAVQIHLANMATQLTAARALIREALRHKARYGRADMLASMAKLFATEATMQITQDAMRVLGGYGYVAEFPIERLYREAPIYMLTEGSNEIQRMIIAREMVKSDGPARLGLE